MTDQRYDSGRLVFLGTLVYLERITQQRIKNNKKKEPAAAIWIESPEYIQSV